MQDGQIIKVQSRKQYFKQQKRKYRNRVKYEEQQQIAEIEEMLSMLDALKLESSTFSCDNDVLEYILQRQCRLESFLQWAAANNKLDEETQRHFTVNLGLPHPGAPVRLLTWHQVTNMNISLAMQMVATLFQDTAEIHNMDTSPASAEEDEQIQRTVDHILLQCNIYGHELFSQIFNEFVKHAMKNPHFMDDLRGYVTVLKLSDKQLHFACCLYQRQLKRHLEIYQQRDIIKKQLAKAQQLDNNDKGQSVYQIADMLSRSILAERCVMIEWELVIPRCIGAKQYMYINMQLFPQKLEFIAFGHALFEVAEKRGDIVSKAQVENIRKLEEDTKRFLTQGSQNVWLIDASEARKNQAEKDQAQEL